MTQYEELAKIKVEEAITQGVESQRIKRLREEERDSGAHPRKPGMIAKIYRVARGLIPSHNPEPKSRREESGSRPV